MNDISTTIMNPSLDTTTGKPLVFPIYESLNIPKTPNYRNGARSNVSSFGTHDLSNFVGTYEDLISDIGADFEAIKVPSYRQRYNGAFEPVKNDSYLINSKTEAIIGKGITDRYSIFQFKDAIYYLMAMIEMIKKMGNINVIPAFGQVFNNGSRLFLQYKLDGTTIKGEPIDTYITLLSSHDKSSGLTIALTAVRCFCKNCISRAMKQATHKLTLRHTESNRMRIESEAQKLIESRNQQIKALNDYAEYLSKIKITEKQLYENFADYRGLSSMTTQRQIDTFTEQAKQLIACYRQPDVANFTGTALGAYYGYSDYDQHIVPARKTSDITYIENSLDGNLALGQFTDSLVARVL